MQLVIAEKPSVAQPDAYSDAWKKWNYESLSMIPEEWQTEVKSDTAAQYKVLKGLMHDARMDSVVCATDIGRILRTFKIKKNVEVTDKGDCERRNYIRIGKATWRQRVKALSFFFSDSYNECSYLST